MEAMLMMAGCNQSSSSFGVVLGWHIWLRSHPSTSSFRGRRSYRMPPQRQLYRGKASLDAQWKDDGLQQCTQRGIHSEGAVQTPGLVQRAYKKEKPPQKIEAMPRRKVWQSPQNWKLERRLFWQSRGNVEAASPLDFSPLVLDGRIPIMQLWNSALNLYENWLICINRIFDGKQHRRENLGSFG